MKCLCEALDNVNLDEINSETEDESEKVTPEVIEKMKSILTDYSDENDLDGQIDETINNEIDSVASLIAGSAQDFGKETDIIAQRDIVTSSNSSERESPIPLHSVAQKPFHGKLNSSLKEDYPESYGHIDQNGNWEKTNKKTNQYDFVHKSGTKFSIYDNGDLVVHCIGNKKEIIEGDYILEVGNNFDISIGNNQFVYIMKDKKEEVDGNVLHLVHKTRQEEIDIADIKKVPFENVVASTSIKLDTPIVVATENIGVGKDVKAGNDVISAGVSLETHIHTQTDGNDNGGGTETTPPVGGGASGGSSSAGSDSSGSSDGDTVNASGEGDSVRGKDESKPKKDTPQESGDSGESEDGDGDNSDSEENNDNNEMETIFYWNPTSYSQIDGLSTGLGFEKAKSILDKYDINTRNRVAGFFAQCSHESGNFRCKEENLNYSQSSLMTVFGRYFPTQESTVGYARNPEKIGSKVYENRMGNGSENTQDGYTYRGKGYIQLTGKNNYESFANQKGMSVEEVTEYLSTNEGAFESAVFYWSNNGLNSLADADDIVQMTKRINGGTNGLQDRKSKYEKYKKALEKEVPKG